MATVTPLPAGAKIWRRPVPPELTAWASAIVHDPATYPMGSTTTGVFGGVPALARVEWHTWTNRGGQRVTVNPPIRGVTVYELGAVSAACAPSMSLVPGAPATCDIVDPDEAAAVQPWDAADVAAVSNVGRWVAFGVGSVGAYLLTRWWARAAA